MWPTSSERGAERIKCYINTSYFRVSFTYVMWLQVCKYIDGIYHLQKYYLALCGKINIDLLALLTVD